LPTRGVRAGAVRAWVRAVNALGQAHACAVRAHRQAHARAYAVGIAQVSLALAQVMPYIQVMPTVSRWLDTLTHARGERAKE